MTLFVFGIDCLIKDSSMKNRQSLTGGRPGFKHFKKRKDEADAENIYIPEECFRINILK